MNRFRTNRIVTGARHLRGLIILACASAATVLSPLASAKDIQAVNMPKVNDSNVIGDLAANVSKNNIVAPLVRSSLSASTAQRFNPEGGVTGYAKPIAFVAVTNKDLDLGALKTDISVGINKKVGTTAGTGTNSLRATNAPDTAGFAINDSDSAAAISAFASSG